MNEKQQRNCDLQERLIEFAVRVLDVVESLTNSIPSLPFPSSLHHSLLDIRYSILTAIDLRAESHAAIHRMVNCRSAKHHSCIMSV